MGQIKNIKLHIVTDIKQHHVLFLGINPVVMYNKYKITRSRGQHWCATLLPQG